MWGLIWCDLIDLTSLRTAQMTTKNIVWLLINIQDEIFFIYKY
jgi:hypothetical protein